MSSLWKESLKQFHDLIEEAVEASEEREIVAVSNVAQQYYCEKKVELSLKYGREATEEMLLGREAHDALLRDAVKVKREQVWRKIFRGDPVFLREMPLLGKHQDLYIAGVADAVFFFLGLPVFLFEYKFTRSQIPFRDYHVQARQYCLLLNKMGFDTTKLKYVLVLAPPEYKNSKDVRNGVLKKMLQQMESKQDFSQVLTIDEVKVYINAFKVEEALKELEWASGFWKQERKAIPTSKPGKCRVCEFNQKCESSLVNKLDFIVKSGDDRITPPSSKAFSFHQT